MVEAIVEETLWNKSFLEYHSSISTAFFKNFVHNILITNIHFFLRESLLGKGISMQIQLNDKQSA